MSAPEIITLPPRDGVSMKLRLRWGVEQDDIPALEVLHVASFPVTYNYEYYHWLLSDSCLALIAFTTPNCIKSLLTAAENDKNTAMESDTKNSSNDSDVDCGESGSLYSVIVGFCIGQAAYGRRIDGRLLSTPTGYLGSFAVDNRVQRRGVGEVLLDRFLSYMLFSIPVPPHLFLDYSPPPYGREHLWRVGSALAAVGVTLAQWWFGKRRAGANTAVGEALRHTNSSDVGSPAVNTHNSEGQVGLGEVWLHCLASDTNVLRFYVKRGFACTFLAKNFYFFDGCHHHGMLLVYRRDASPRACHERDSTCSTAPALEKAVSHTNSLATGSTHGIRPRRCQSISPEALEDDLTVTSIEVPLATDLSGLRQEWSSAWREDSTQPHQSKSLSSVLLRVVEAAAAFLFCVALLVTCGV
ncbi:acetyltransferase [Trypanosoma conorhini]|uniref:histone acetyltransferase n=1 Tax=Trypanosoma conorhini TaxID=83891 RepID=A0A422N6U1_9TRYP|nr:acetyltransferase [Trypanosoma conorhini]RNF01161.1 acetyltransferase [Trypanosoma conorhini]